MEYMPRKSLDRVTSISLNEGHPNLPPLLHYLAIGLSVFGCPHVGTFFSQGSSINTNPHGSNYGGYRQGRNYQQGSPLAGSLSWRSRCGVRCRANAICTERSTLRRRSCRFRELRQSPDPGSWILCAVDSCTVPCFYVCG